jgi:hypothetical protein
MAKFCAVSCEDFGQSAIGYRDNEAEGCVRAREAADFVVGQAGGFAGCDYVELAYVLTAFGVDHPDSAIFGD